MKCFLCNVQDTATCKHVAYRAACNDCEWERLTRRPPKETMCPKCRRWLSFVKLEAGKDGYW